MKSIQLLSVALLLITITHAQNVGIGNTNPQSVLDVQGDIRFRSVNLAAVPFNGELNVATTRASTYNFIGAAIITGIAGGVDGRLITLVNTAGSTLIKIKLLDEYDAASTSNISNKIILGGNTYTILTKGSLVLRYDGMLQRWSVVSKNGVSDGIAPMWVQNGNNITNYNTGNVGIGTTLPSQAKLVANSASNVSTNAIFGSNGNGLSFQKNYPTISYNAYRDSTNTNRYIGTGYGFSTSTDPTTGLYFWNKLGTGVIDDTIGIKEQYVMGISQLGNVGIGTLPYDSDTFPNSQYRLAVNGKFKTNYIYASSAWFNTGVGIMTQPDPSYPLVVNGTIRSKEVIVESGWADYVFDDGYALKNLDSTENFIKTNKHLPNMPSAKDIQQNGLTMGAMQTKMMEKIEELTLYIIEANKKIEALEKQVGRSKK